MPSCQACGRTVEVRERVGFRDTCEGCGADLHVCLNCALHDPGAHNQCRETQADPVVEKDRANRCDWFQVPEVSRGARADSENAGAAAGDAKGKEDEARAKLDGLFRKPGDAPAAPKPGSKAALDALFAKKKP
jgi:hypothetical protein